MQTSSRRSVLQRGAAFTTVIGLIALVGAVVAIMQAQLVPKIAEQQRLAVESQLAAAGDTTTSSDVTTPATSEQKAQQCISNETYNIDIKQSGDKVDTTIERVPTSRYRCYNRKSASPAWIESNGDEVGNICTAEAKTDRLDCTANFKLSDGKTIGIKIPPGDPVDGEQALAELKKSYTQAEGDFTSKKTALEGLLGGAEKDAGQINGAAKAAKDSLANLQKTRGELSALDAALNPDQTPAQAQQAEQARQKHEEGLQNWLDEIDTKTTGAGTVNETDASTLARGLRDQSLANFDPENVARLGSSTAEPGSVETDTAATASSDSEKVSSTHTPGSTFDTGGQEVSLDDAARVARERGLDPSKMTPAQLKEYAARVAAIQKADTDLEAARKSRAARDENCSLLGVPCSWLPDWGTPAGQLVSEAEKEADQARTKLSLYENTLKTGTGAGEETTTTPDASPTTPNNRPGQQDPPDETRTDPPPRTSPPDNGAVRQLQQRLAAMQRAMQQQAAKFQQALQRAQQQAAQQAQQAQQAAQRAQQQAQQQQNACNKYPGTRLVSGSCKCPSGQSWSGSKCERANACSKYPGATLVNGQCQCPQTQKWNGQRCIDENKNPNAQLAADLSCAPLVQEVGAPVAISFACRGAQTASAQGFETGNELSGSANPNLSVPSNATSRTYTLVCRSSNGQEKRDQCTVNATKAILVTATNPNPVESGKTARIGWITKGMRTCSIQATNSSQAQASEFNSQYQNKDDTNGVATTPALTEQLDVRIRCTTDAGTSKTADVEVGVSSQASS